MNILLIQPKDSPASVFRWTFRPLTLEILAACLGEHQCDIYDMRVDETPLAQKLQAFGPQVVGITCPFTATVPTVIALAEAIKALAPRTLVVVGGVHPSLFPDDFRDSAVDVIVHGAGERVLSRSVAAREAGTPLEGISSIHLKGPDGFRFTGASPGLPDLKSFPLPARHLTRKYTPKYLRSPKGQTMCLTITSRGCPHRCNFCAAWKVQAGRYLTREPQGIVEEIKTIEEELIYFFDDNAFGSARMMRTLAEQIKAEGIRKEYQMWASADAIVAHEDLVRSWADIGLKRMFVGFEACSDEQLKAYGKRATVATNERAHAILKQYGVDLSPSFIVRYDFTHDDFDALHRYLVSRQFMMPYILIYTPLPGTELWQIHQAELTTRDYEHYDLYHLTMRPENMTTGDFMNRFTGLYLQNPSWQALAARSPIGPDIIRSLMNLRSLYETVPQSKAT